MNQPGLSSDPIGFSDDDYSTVRENDREYFQRLAIEQKKLTSSLQALTSHFAKVQFRLRQIIIAPDEQKSNLIENLDEFASRGIIDDEENDCTLYTINQQQVNQFKLIKKLQTESSVASNFANEKAIKFEVNKNDTEIMNEESVNHLKTEIHNLDTLVADLQYETTNLKHMAAAMVGYRTCDEIYVPSTRSTCQSISDEDDNILTEYGDFGSISARKNPSSTIKRYEQSLNDVRQRPLTDFKSPTKCSSSKVCHWGHIQAKLEIDVQNIISVVSIEPLETHQFEQQTNVKLMSQKEITKMIRKELCGTLRELIEHGLRSKGYELNFLRCCIRRIDKRNDSKWKSKHAWDIIMEFYNLNDGNRRYRTPSNTLNESFRLNRTSFTSQNKELLKAIGDIINIHVRCNTNPNSYFKAFVLLGLNRKKLPHWLNIIFNCTDLIEANYSDSSLVRQSEFFDILECLDSLSAYELNLPIDTLADRLNNGMDKNVFD